MNLWAYLLRNILCLVFSDGLRIGGFSSCTLGCLRKHLCYTALSPNSRRCEHELLQAFIYKWTFQTCFLTAKKFSSMKQETTEETPNYFGKSPCPHTEPETAASDLFLAESLLLRNEVKSVDRGASV